MISRYSQRFQPWVPATGAGPTPPLTELLTDFTAWVMPVSGNDGTGVVGRLDLPFATVQAALTAIFATGDTSNWLVILPGDYAEDVVFPAFTGDKRLTIMGSGRPTTRIRSLEIAGPTVLADDLFLDIEDITFGELGPQTKAPVSFTDTVGGVDVGIDHCDMIVATTGINCLEQLRPVDSSATKIVRLSHCELFPAEGVASNQAYLASGGMLETEMVRMRTAGLGVVALFTAGAVNMRETILIAGAGRDVVFSSAIVPLSFEDCDFETTGFAANAVFMSGTAAALTLTGHSLFRNPAGGTGGLRSTGSGPVTYESFTTVFGTRPTISGFSSEIDLLIPDKTQLRIAGRITVVGPTLVATNEKLMPVDTVAIGAASGVTLPLIATVGIGKEVIVKDVTGAGAANPITVDTSGADTIDLAGSAIIGADFGALSFTAESAGNWSIV